MSREFSTYPGGHCSRGCVAIASAGLRTKKTRGPYAKLSAEQMSSLHALLVGAIHGN